MVKQILSYSKIYGNSQVHMSKLIAPEMALITASRRTPIASRNGIFKNFEIEELCKPVIESVIKDANISKSDIDCIILGNALGAGGNPARLCSLFAEIPESCPALTIDTQCCSGIDAIGIAAARINSGQADVILAGGVESYSRAPLRARLNKEDNYVPYTQAKFYPCESQNLNVFDQINSISKENNISFDDQCDLAIESHRKAKAWIHPDIVSFNAGDLTIKLDTFTRLISRKICSRANQDKKKINPCLTANEADGAAMSILMSKKFFNSRNFKKFALEVQGWHQFGYDPKRPALISENFFKQNKLCIDQFDQIEWMESFASQFLTNKRTFNLPNQKTNPYGGMIAMGHPIGASGAILVSRLYQGLKIKSAFKGALKGLAVIPSAGGLVSAINVSKFTT